MNTTKKGVSLVAVLLFMLVATIAGTATYKWLSSAGKSSSSRMLQSEARMAAVAGIESARSWFSHHGNETGAVIKQFRSAKKPVTLDNQLVSVKKDNQEYTVSVVDVDVSSQPYKVKVVSEGTARNGSKYSETAVFKVNGLYRVPVPVQRKAIDYEYAYFGGTTTFSSGHKATSMLINGNWSGNPGDVTKDFIVTGTVSLSGDNISIGEYACLGGAVNAQNGIVAGNLYSASDFTNFNGTIANDAYFGGDVSFGSVANKPTDRGNYGGFAVGGSMTLNGTMSATDGSYANGYTIGNNMCLTENGKLVLKTSPKVFSVENNVWIPAKASLTTLYGYNPVDAKYAVLGNQSTSKVYVEDYAQCEGFYKETCPSDEVCGLTVSASKLDYGFNACPSGSYYQGSDEIVSKDCKEWNYVYTLVHPEWNGGWYEYVKDGCKNLVTYDCDMSTTVGFFTTKGHLNGILPSKPDFTCGEGAKTHCDNIWEKRKGCDNSEYFVDDMLVTSYEEFKVYAAKAKCDSKIEKLSKASVATMNKCYKDISNDAARAKKELYNGYLVVSLTPDFNLMNGVGVSDSLNGKFIIIYDTKLGQAALPPTTKNSSVFLYLKDGSSSTIDCKCPNKDEVPAAYQTDALAAAYCKDSINYNYFIFTNNSIQGLLGACKYSGSMYAVAEKCAAIGNVNGSVELEYNANVVSAIASAGIVCTKGTVCDGNPSATSSGASSGSESTSEDGLDSVFVAVGSNLLIELESQYKTTEKVSREAQNVESSIVVLPRIVYLNDNAQGKLLDYISPVALNNARNLGDGSIDNCKELYGASVYSTLKNEPMVSSGSKLNQGMYSCTYKNTMDNKNYASEFYVVVLGDAAAVPPVSFDGSQTVNLSTTEETSTDVSLNIDGVNNGSGSFTIDIRMTGNLDWNIVAHNGLTIVEQSATEKVYRYSGTVSSSDQQVQLFTVTTSSTSSTGNLWMVLDNAVNCIPSAPVIKNLSLRGEVTIARKGMKEYCNSFSDSYCDDIEILDATDLAEASCEDLIKSNFGTNYEWVSAVGDECSVLEKQTTPANVNNKWKCYTGAAVHLAQKNASTIEKYCDVYIPGGEHNELTTFAGNGEKYLYAEARRKKFKLNLNLIERNGASVTIYYGKSPVGIFELDKAISSGTLKTVTCNSDQCDVDLYAGYHVYLKGNSTTNSKFSTFSYYTGTPRVKKTESSNPFHIAISSDTTISAEFNQRDYSCFYDDFKSTKVFCDNSCSSDAKSCNCIDQCTAGDDHCSISEDHNYLNANWILVYDYPRNKCIDHCNSLIYSKEYAGLRSSNGLYFDNKDENERNGEEAVLLSYVNAGYNGSFSASFKTGVVEGGKTVGPFVCPLNKDYDNTHYLNSGFILRSDESAGTYLTLSIYGRNCYGTDLAALKTFARVCANNGKTLTNNATCVEQEVVDKDGNSLAELLSDPLTMEAVINGNELSVKLSYKIASWTTWGEYFTTFDLNDSKLKGVFDNVTEPEKNNIHVGLKLADPHFKVLSAAWRTFDSSECWDTPYTTCSFSSNYVGGRVPLKQDVSPWVGISSWFSDKSCSVKYFYNGCDMEGGNNSRRYKSGIGNWLNSISGGVQNASCSAISDDGYYWGTADGGKNGAELASGAKYSFLYEGFHGEEKSTPYSGIVRNASVLVSCSGIAQNYVANCGSFWVGPITECTKNEVILPTEDVPVIERSAQLAGEVYTIELAQPINLRASSLAFGFAPGSASVSVYLRDSEGHTSANGSVSVGNPILSIDEKLIDVYGFDPENVVSISLNSTDYYKINSLRSQCSNAPEAVCEGATYNSTSNTWTLNGSAVNGNSCALTLSVGDVTSSDYVEGSTISESVPCNALSMPGFGMETQITVATQYTLSLTVNSGFETEHCNAPVVTLYPQSAAGSSASTATPAATCSITKDNATGIVTYSFSDISGCDRDCSVTVLRNNVDSFKGCSSVSDGSNCGTELEEDGVYSIYFNEQKMTGDCGNFEVKRKSDPPAGGGTGDGSLLIGNTDYSFTVESGKKVCFNAHPVEYDWQTKAHLQCTACNAADCIVSIDDVSGSHGWDAPTIDVDLSADKTYTGCHTISRTDGGKVSCKFGW